jgi:hypothetical protein
MELVCSLIHLRTGRAFALASLGVVQSAGLYVDRPATRNETPNEAIAAMCSATKFGKPFFFEMEC